MTIQPIKIIKDGHVASPQGFVAGVTVGNIKYQDRLDTAVLFSQHECTAAAVFTQNQVLAAPVLVDQEVLSANPNRIRGVVMNAGNANACTGEPGLAAARGMQQITAEATDCQPEQFFVLSTGVIGLPMPMDRVEAAIRMASQEMTVENGRLTAEAIMTTDTHPKRLAIRVSLPEGEVIIGGMAKGAGMIHPNMATMLAVISTDAEIEPNLLQHLLSTAVSHSFNRISIDGDTSTNDTVLLLANGASGVTVVSETAVSQFKSALTQLCQTLAHQIVKDGEGASKFVEIEVTGTATDDDAHQIGNTIATSPLVKTAFAGSDPNWGRILAAAGRAGIPFDQRLADLWIGVDQSVTLQLLQNGTPTNYQEADAAAVFAEPAFKIRLDLHQGNGRDTVWTSDLTHAYITINADYRT
jgi:glutamate N-acetyltransferase/amino-acid N-acetyltransferase